MKHGVVAVLRDADRFLVILRGQSVVRPGYWTPLSGRIEPGESQPEALVREVREEVGLEVTPLAKVWECPTDDGSFQLHWWTATITGGALEPDGVEVADARWVTPAEFATLSPTFEADHEFVERVLPTLRQQPGTATTARQQPGGHEVAGNSETRASVWTGRVMSALSALFLLVDGVMKLVKPEPVVKATVELGYPESVIVCIGIVLLVCVVLYIVPRTSILGAILLTGYLGGAIATHVRVGSPLFTHTLFPLYLAVLVWGGLYLRDRRLHTILPLRSSEPG